MQKRSRRKTPVYVCQNCGKELFDSKRNKTGLCLTCLNEKRSREANRCIDCGKRIMDSTHLRCMDCHRKHVEAEKNHCVDCGKEIVKASTRCRECGFKFRARNAAHCIDCGKQLKQGTTKRCKECHLKFMSSERSVARMSASRATAMKNRTKRSRAEDACAELLELYKIEYEEQVPYGRWIIDFVIPDRTIVIEVMGEYWHERPSNIERDVRKKSTLEKKGYTVIYLKSKEQHLWFLEFQKLFGYLRLNQEES